MGRGIRVDPQERLFDIPLQMCIIEGNDPGEVTVADR